MILKLISIFNRANLILNRDDMHEDACHLIYNYRRLEIHNFE